MAMPSPVDSVGLVVTANSWPAPPVATSTWRARTSRRVAVGVAGDHAGAAAALDEQVERRTSARSSAAAVRRTAATSARSTSTPGRRAAGVDDAGVRVAALAGQQQLARGVAVEDGAEGDQLVDPGRALVDQHPHGVGVAQPGAGGQRVGQVQVGRVGVAAQHRGHAALGPPGGRLVQLALGQHADPQAVDVGGPHRGRQAGDADPEDQQVEDSRPSSARPRERAGSVGRHLDVAARRRAPRELGGQQLGGDLVDRPVGGVDVHDAGLVAAPARRPRSRRR